MNVDASRRFEPYDALRQKFWKEYIKSYDEDNTGKISLMELQAVGARLHPLYLSQHTDCDST